MMRPYYVVAVSPGRGEVSRTGGLPTLDIAREQRDRSAAQDETLLYHIRDGHNECVVNINGEFCARLPEEE